MRIELREARPGDELPVAELHVRAWQDAYRGLIAGEFLDALDPRDRARRYAFETSGAAAPTTLLAVAVGEDRGEAIAGFVTFGPSRDEDARGRGEVYALYVDPDRYRRGNGRVLMTAARSRLREAGFTEAILWVLQGNDRATRFYEGEGWRPDGATRTEQPYGIVTKVHRFRRDLP